MDIKKNLLLTYSMTKSKRKLKKLRRKFVQIDKV